MIKSVRDIGEPPQKGTRTIAAGPALRNGLYQCDSKALLQKSGVAVANSTIGFVARTTYEGLMVHTTDEGDAGAS